VQADLDACFIAILCCSRDGPVRLIDFDDAPSRCLGYRTDVFRGERTFVGPDIRSPKPWAVDEFPARTGDRPSAFLKFQYVLREIASGWANDVFRDTRDLRVELDAVV